MAKRLQIDPLNRLRDVDQDKEKLALVAEMMDEFFMIENACYAEALEAKNRYIQLLKQQVQRLEAEKSQYLQRIRAFANVVVEQRDILEDNLDSNLDWLPEVTLDDQGVPDIDIDLRAEPEIIDLTGDDE